MQSYNGESQPQTFATYLGPNFGLEDSASGSGTAAATKPASRSLDQALKKAKQGGILDLQGCGLSKFPEDVRELQDLNAIEPWWDTYDLQKLDLSCNQLTHLSEEIANCESLWHVRLNSNSLRTLPFSLFASSSLKLLDLSNNQLSHLPEAIGGAQALVELHAGGNALSKVCESLGDLANLEVLDLRKNQIAALPEKFGNLEKLSQLNLSNNELQSVPACIRRLTALMDLNMSANQIWLIESDALVHLKSLVILDLSRNSLTDFSSVPKSPDLEELNLNYNQLKALRCLSNAPNLVDLNLHDNQFTSFPEMVCELKNLQTLNIFNNDLNQVDPRLALMDKLSSLNIRNNPLKYMKPAVRMLDAQAIKKHLLTRLPQEEQQTKAVKHQVHPTLHPGKKVAMKDTATRKIEALFDSHDANVDLRMTKSKFPALSKITSQKAIIPQPDVKQSIETKLTEMRMSMENFHATVPTFDFDDKVKTAYD